MKKIDVLSYNKSLSTAEECETLKGVDSTGKDVRILQETLFSGRSVRTTQSFFNDGALFALGKYIGAMPENGTLYDILIAPVDNSGGKVNLSGIIGRILYTRGGPNQALMCGQFDIIATRGYTKTQLSSSDADYKVGFCQYKGQTYIALRIPETMSRGFYFIGIYSADCIFKFTPQSDSIWEE